MFRSLLLAATLCAAAASPAAAVTFAFDGLVNRQTDFSIASGALTATFSSSSGPMTFSVAQPFGLYDFPVALGDYGASPGDPLTITFSDPVMDQIIIPFGIEQAFATVPATLVARADTGQTVTFTTAFASMLASAPQGVATFVPTGPIRALTLTSPIAFAIASVDLQPAVAVVDMPEPTSIVVLGLGLLGVVALRRRGTQRQVAAAADQVST